MLLSHALLPAPEGSEDGATVVSAGATVSTARDIGAEDGSTIARNVGSIVSVGDITVSGTSVGGDEGRTATGVGVHAAASVGTGERSAGWLEKAAGATEDVGSGDGRTGVGDGVTTGINDRGRA